MSAAVSRAVFAIETASPRPAGKDMEANPKQDELHTNDGFAERVRIKQLEVKGKPEGTIRFYRLRVRFFRMCGCAPSG
jgi:hypothetical protein